MSELIVPSRFCGPASSGNGGWTAGALAGLVPLAPLGRRESRADAWSPIEVSLRRPPPLDTPMSVTEENGVTVARSDGVLVAEARPTDHHPTPVEPVSAADARAAEASYHGLTRHPFPTCFACGTGREPGDGLRIFPGEITGEKDADTGATRVAATWTPHPSVGEDLHPDIGEQPRASLATTWAALDCVGGWAGDLTDRLMVLGRMTAGIEALPVIGEEHVVVGQAVGRDGRKTFTASTLYDVDGRVVASAQHVWIAIDPADFG